MASRVRWEGVDRVGRNIERYGDRAREAVDELLRYYERVIEAYAKQYAPWTDRTSNARQNLFAHVDRDGNSVRLYLSHRVEYGIWLELKYSGRYAVILPTLQNHETAIMNSIRQLFA
jgi:hypothetical protein